jgi:endonuclease G
MDANERAKRLKRMLSQVAPGGLETVIRPRSTGFAQEGLEAVDQSATVESGLQKLAEDRHGELTNQELFTLEAIVLPQNRPVVFVRGQSYDDVADPWTSLDAADVKVRFSALFPLIGRVELPLNSLVPYGGTGFVVGKNLLMTNRHVAELFSRGLGLTIRYQPGGSAVDFHRQIDTPDDDRSAYLTVRGVQMIHPYWDMALLQVDNLPTDRALRLSVKSPEDLMGTNIVAVGYPAKDFRNDQQLQDNIFKGVYNVKRLQPGKIRARAQIQSFEHVVNAMTHDASTLGGNSGSAIINVDTAEVVALHFAGEYLKANYAVPMYELARDKRVAPLLNFDGSVAPTNDWEPAWLSTMGAEDALAPKRVTPPSPAPGTTAPLQWPSPAPQAGCDQAVTWTIPIQFSVTIGQPAAPSLGAVAPGALGPEIHAEVEEAVVVNQDYSDRPGYDPDFLEDITVPLPILDSAMQAITSQVDVDSRPHGDPFELAYYHYSVYMNKKRRTAWFSAANVDGDNRPAIGKRQGDRWYVDTRIPKSDQLGQNPFESGIDRGHLTRREDTAWGEEVESATAANNDTFHFTNCSLQVSAFNRGKDRWQGLEQFLLEQHAKKDKRRMIVVTGPVFASGDPVYQNERMTYNVRFPMKFWKVCVLISEKTGKPSATGFILGQPDAKDLPGVEETFDVGATQVKISDLQKQTGLDFGDLVKHDHFAEGGSPGTLESPMGAAGETLTVKLIREGSDIVV